MFKNKSDIPGAMSEDEVRDVSVESDVCWDGRVAMLTAHKGLGLDQIHTHTWTIMSCSAMTGQNLQEGLQWVVQDAKARLFLY